ncbi:MAG TPA: mandelate racemase/muconate lactonizing enzyme family protein [Mesorhizobium sp.]|jgi:L-alanine-DL-glutamate epimerase-like enolase superfamily enzyme|nr:mandelate racemase/muconate lactonizing enzyme family protein [Mesorhizobium sp.]
MRITAIETIRIPEFGQLVWLYVHTDEGLVGLGETFFAASAVEAYLHDVVWPKLEGRNPLAIDAISRDLVDYLGFRSSGVETRAASAVDIALWDLFGRATGQPIAQLLGGFTREKIRTYNTCAGTGYMRKPQGQGTANWGLGADPSLGLDDLNAFLTRADELAESLLAEGISAMKIWPFDIPAEKTRGWDISAQDLRKALEPFEKIRARVGDRMDIMVEFHGLWQMLPALRIARALEPFGTYWHEDPIRLDVAADLARYAAQSPAPVCLSETLATRHSFRELLETNAAGVIMLDLAWCGGISEAKKIATMAEAWKLPVAPHDCTGPVVLAASTHLSLNAPNALIQESVRAFRKTWYRDLVTEVPPVEDGFITVPSGPGLGLDLDPEIDKKFTVTRRRSGA